jgi:hypothetical protein
VHAMQGVIDELRGENAELHRHVQDHISQNNPDGAGNRGQADEEDVSSAGASWGTDSWGGSTLVGSDDEDDHATLIGSDDGWPQIESDGPVADDGMGEVDVSYFEAIEGVTSGEELVVAVGEW